MLHFPIRLFYGSYENIKITTPEDLGTAEGFLKNRYWHGFYICVRINSVAQGKYSKVFICGVYMERYRSGHNEAVLKTVCPKGRVGSNPTLSVLRTEAERLPFIYLLINYGEMFSVFFWKSTEMSHFLYLRKKYWTMEGISCILNSGHFGEVPKLAEGAPLERE